MLSEISQMETNKYHRVSLISYVEYKIKQKRQTKPKQPDNLGIRSRVVVTGGGGGAKWVGGQLYGDRWKINFWW